MALAFVRRHPRWAWILAVAVLLTLLVIAFLPRAIRWGIERWLENQGPLSAEVENVDFNPFSGNLMIDTLIAEREAAPGGIAVERARFTIDFWPLAQRRIELDTIALQDAVVTVRRAEGVWYLGGLKIASRKGRKKESGWQFGFGDIDLQNVRIRYLDEGKTESLLQIDELHLGGMQAWNPDADGDFSTSLRIGGGVILLSGVARPFAERPLLDGRLQIREVHLEQMEDWWQGLQVRFRQAPLSADLKLQARLRPETGRVHLEARGSAQAGALALDLPQGTLQGDGLSWEGLVELAAPREEQPPMVRSEGIFASPGMSYALGNAPYDLRLGSTELSADFSMGTDQVPQDASFLLTLNASTDALSAEDRKKGLTAGDVRKLHLDEVRLEGMQTLHAGSVEADSLHLLERQKETMQPSYYLSLGEVLLQDFRTDFAQLYALDTAKIEGLQATLRRGAEGKIELAPWDFLETTEEAEEKGEESAPAPEIRLGSVQIGGESRIDYTDQTVKPALELDLQPIRLRVEDLQTAGDTPTRFEVTLQANGHPLHLQGETRPFGDEMTASGHLNLQDWPLELARPWLGEKARISGGAVTIDSAVNVLYAPEKKLLQLETQGSAHLTDLLGEIESLRIADGEAAWEGTFRYEDAGQGEESPPSFSAEGTLTIPRAQALLPSQSLMIQGQSLRFDGKLTHGREPPPDGPPFSLQAQGEIGPLSLSSTKKDLRLFEVDGVRLSGLEMQGPEQIHATELHLESPQFLKNPGGQDFLAGARSMAFAGLNMNGTSDISLDSMKVIALEGKLVRNEKGAFSFLEWISVEEEQPPPEDKEKEEDESPREASLRIASVEVNDESRINFIDLSVSPAVRLVMAPFHLSMKNFDLSAPATPSPISLNTRFSKYSRLHLEGTVSDFTEEPTLSLQGELTNLSLPPLRGYTEHFIGYTIGQGNMDLQFSIDIDEGELDADSSLKLTKLEIEPLKTAEREETDANLGFPLGTGLSLLRDRDGNIKFDLPVSGDVDSPKFGFEGVIQKALFKTIRTAALSYFSPIGAVANLGRKFIIDRFRALRFNPVIFPPGETVLTPEAQQYLNETAARLKARPGTDVVVCGVVVRQDIVSLAEQDPSTQTMLRLGQARAEKVRGFLVAQGIDPGRLVQCTPEVDREEGADPRVEIGI